MDSLIKPYRESAGMKIAAMKSIRITCQGKKQFLNTLAL